MLTRLNFPDLYLEKMLPALVELSMGRYNRYPSQYGQFFRSQSAPKGFVQYSGITGLPLMEHTPEGQDYHTAEFFPRHNKTLYVAQYSLGYSVTNWAKTDDRNALIAKMATDLGKSAQETREVVAAGVFNTGFTTNGPDGVPLFSTAHPRYGSMGGTQTNCLSYSTQPDVTSVQLALTDFRQMKDDTHRLLRIPARRMVVPNGLEWAASIIMTNSMNPETANHANNPLQNRLGMPSFNEVKVWEYLTDQNAWFIQGEVEDTSLVFIENEAFNIQHDIVFKSRNVETAGWQKFGVGFYDYPGVYGIPS